MKRKVIALGLFTIFTAGLSLTLTTTGSAESFAKGRSPSYAAAGCSRGLSPETANIPLSLFRTSSTYDITDLIAMDRGRMPLTANSPTVSSRNIPSPAAPPCFPIEHCLFAGCYYELLNSPGFENPSCNPNWIFPPGYVTPSSSICNTTPFATTFSKVAVLPYASGFNQSVEVPDEDGSMSVAVIFAPVGSPTINDRILVELMEGMIVRRRISIRTDLGPFSCHREDYSFLGDYKGKNMTLRVRSQIVTPGVEYHIDLVQLFYDLS